MARAQARSSARPRRQCVARAADGCDVG
jgi:hypothetical protein